MSKTVAPHRQIRSFFLEPIGDLPVTDLSGIGRVLGARLASAGFDKASTVLGQFLVLKMDKELFVQWLRDICQANVMQANKCYTSLKDWCDLFL